MSVQTLSSSEALTQLRSVLDVVCAEKTDIVITRRKKPVVVMICYADWVASRQALDDLRAVAFSETTQYEADGILQKC